LFILIELGTGPLNGSGLVRVVLLSK